MDGVAGIVCPCTTNITNCYNVGDIINNGGGGITGGITTAGLGGNTITNCYNTGNIMCANDAWYIGGIASGHGNHKITIKNCYNTGKITGGAFAAGGILGTNGEKIENCYNLGMIEGNAYTGGIVGYSSTEVNNCYNTGKIAGSNYVGGICSNTGEKIINCYNLGDIEGNCVGGIAGRNQTDGAIISNCFSICQFYHASYGARLGWILGENSASNVEINNNYSAIKKITKIQNLNSFLASSGGIVGNNCTSTLNKCYYLKTEGVNQAVSGIDDSTLDVLQCTSVNEITADILNENIMVLTHEEEWKEWEQGENYPILKLE